MYRMPATLDEYVQFEMILILGREGASMKRFEFPVRNSVIESLNEYRVGL